MEKSAEQVDSLSDKLAVEEYKSCRDLIAKNIDIIEKSEIYASVLRRR